MKKTVALLLMLTLLLTVFVGCAPDEKPEKETENNSQVEADIENTPETVPEPEIEPEQPVEPESEPETVTEDEAETEPVDEDFFWPGDGARGEDDEDSEAWENMQWYSGEGSIPSENDGHFVSLWPDELPDENRSDLLSSFGSLSVSKSLNNLFLFDFPKPEDYFKCQSQSTYVGVIDTIYYAYQNVDENNYDVSLSPEEFKEYVDAVKAAGYTDAAIETETSYYCEKYGVSVSIVLGNEFPWADDDYRLRADKSQFTDCHIRVQLIDPDYEFDLDAIKAEEYQRWLDSYKNTEQ